MQRNSCRKSRSRFLNASQSNLRGGEALEIRTLLTAGALDSGFGTGGFAEIHPGDAAGAVSANSLVVTADNKIIQVGTAIDPISHKQDIALVRYKTDGTPDGSFGTGGIVLTGVTTGTGQALANQVLLDSQGRILVVGGDGTNFTLFRYDTLGHLDNSFSGDGIASMSIPGTGAHGTAQCAAFDAEGNIIVGGSGFSTERGNFAPLFRFSTNGIQDTSFGLGGVAFGNFPNDVNITEVGSLLVQLDGSIVVGSGLTAADPKSALLRFTPSGRPDPTFGLFGAALASFGNNGETVRGLYQQQDGKLIAVSSAPTSAGFDVARYNTNGTLDPTFSSDGKLTTPFAEGQASAQDVLVDVNGKIIVAGGLKPTGQTTGFFALARYLADGTLDTTFGTAGLTSTLGSAHSDENVANVSLGTDISGNLFLGSSGANFHLARFTGDPAVPNAPILFIGNQAITAPSDGTDSMVFDVLLAQASTEQITVAYSTINNTALAGVHYTAVSGTLTFSPGTVIQSITVPILVQTTPASDKSFSLNLSNPVNAPIQNPQVSGTIFTNQPLVSHSGDLDFTFGWAGFATANPASSPQVAQMVVQADGKIIQVGTASTGATTTGFTVVRYNVDGSLDTGFGNGGIVITSISTGNGHAAAQGVAVQSDGKIVVVGTNGTDFEIVRYMRNGSIDSQFGSAGFLKIAVPGNNVTGRAEEVAIDSLGRILVAGVIVPATGPTTGVVVRVTSGGVHDSNFGPGGFSILNFPGNQTITDVTALEIIADQIIVAGPLAGGTRSWGLVRLTVDGPIDNGFGTSGLANVGFTNLNIVPVALAEQTDHKLVVVGGDVTANNGFYLARYDTSGQLDLDFNGTGMVSTIGTASFASKPWNIVLQADEKIIVSGSLGITGASFSHVILLRYQSNGLLDDTFSTAGGASAKGRSPYTSMNGMGIAPDGKIVVGVAGALVPGSSANDFGVLRFFGDSDAVLPSLSIDDQSLLATTSGTTNLTFHVTLSQAWVDEVTVAYKTVQNTAKAGTDFTAKSGTLTFAPGLVNQTITVPILGNLYVAPEKLFTVQLSSPNGADIVRGAGQGSILSELTPSWHNSLNALDVNADGLVSSLDALIIINSLNSDGPRPLGEVPPGVHFFYDVTDDTLITSLDALNVINHLNDSADRLAPPASPPATPSHAMDTAMFAASLATSSGVSTLASTPVAMASALLPRSADTVSVPAKSAEAALPAVYDEESQWQLAADESLEETLDLLTSPL